LDNEAFHDLYFSLHIIRAMKFINLIKEMNKRGFLGAVMYVLQLI